MGFLKTSIRKFLEGRGYLVLYIPDLPPAPLSTAAQLVTLLKKNGITTVFDIGANDGGYGKELRAGGFTGTIISFEPLSEAFAKLQEAAAGDAKWITLHSAVGDMDGESEINVAANSLSSSILDMLPKHLEAAPHSAYVGKETIQVMKLDTLWAQYVKPSDKVFVKIDAQGYTRQILDGAKQVLPQVKGLYVELSCVPLYAGETLAGEMIHWLEDQGFRLWYIDHEYSADGDYQMLQLNGTFYRGE